MKSFFQKLRLNWFIAKQTLPYTRNYLEQVYKIYLNHNKVIHYRNGYPVYSLSTPALFSEPASNFFARQLFATIQNRNMPNLMSFAVNDDCNVNCAHCSFFEGACDKSRKILSLPQSQKLIKDVQELGVSVINIVGGEPLLRTDLPDILESIDKKLSTVILFTNGLLLSERVQTLKKSGLDGVYVSIDSADEKLHDEIRGSKGCFIKAMEGIQVAQKAGLTVGISCCITEESFRNGELEKIVELGKNNKVHEVLVFDAKPTGRYKNKKNLVDNNEWIEEMIEFSKKYNEDPSYPGILIYAYAMSYRSVGCAGGTSYFYVSPYGDISPCDFNHATFGNILKIPLHKIWEQMSSGSDFQQATWSGCKLSDSSYRDKSTVSTHTSTCGSCSSCK